MNTTCRFSHILDARLESIKAAKPLTLDAAVVTPYSLQAPRANRYSYESAYSQSAVMMMKLLNLHRSTPIMIIQRVTRCRPVDGIPTAGCLR